MSTNQIAAQDSLRARLAEAEETLRAIRHGEIDALAIRDRSSGTEVLTLSGADRPYRMFVENMRDGAATVSPAGIIVYANHRLCEMVTRDLADLVGSPIASLVADGDRTALRAISGSAGPGGTIEVDLLDSGEKRIPVRVSTWSLDVDFLELLCFTFADLTEQHAQQCAIEALGRAQASRLRELEHAQAALTKQATHDSLSGLPNRVLLVDRMTQALAHAKRSHVAIGLIFLDLDRFKQINDTCGHGVGDTVLREVADRIVGAVRPMDTVARIGGDEIIVLLPALGRPLEAVTVGQRIAEAIEAPIELDEGVMSVTASMGITACDDGLSGPQLTPDQLLAQADAAMYYAKSLGGSRIELFDASTPRVVEAEPDGWVPRIRSALDEDRLVLYAQPIIELATGAIVQEELLLRMQDVDGSIIPPLAFLPTAERCGLISEIDRWVITEATRLAGSGRAVTVNLSATSAGSPEMLRLIERQLANHGADPRNIVFEITETAVMQNVDQAKLFAERMIELGCEFALDDFGTGFASFTYLKHLPVQYLKIDIDFVRDLARSDRDVSVVKAIVSLARDFGQRTIAEGVEDEETAEALRSLGVQLAQGYLFGRPRPITDRTPPGPEPSAREVSEMTARLGTMGSAPALIRASNPHVAESSVAESELSPVDSTRSESSSKKMH
jgi:diguanylate cyclase (GGDEF)-like protein/PAS domain S-box-containing protein